MGCGMPRDVAQKSAGVCYSRLTVTPSAQQAHAKFFYGIKRNSQMRYLTPELLDGVMVKELTWDDKWIGI